jgi:hypothetical protein
VRFSNNKDRIQFPDAVEAQTYHASGGGLIDASFTGSTLVTLDCTALADRCVAIWSEIASSHAAGSSYRYCWLTAAEVSGAAFRSSDGGGLNPANNAKVWHQFDGNAKFPKADYVSKDRPHLAYHPLSNITTAETIIVAVAQPDSLS